MVRPEFFILILSVLILFLFMKSSRECYSPYRNTGLCPSNSEKESHVQNKYTRGQQLYSVPNPPNYTRLKYAEQRKKMKTLREYEKNYQFYKDDNIH